MPLFFIPILAFSAWVCLLVYYFPALKLDLVLTDPLLGALFFISFPILILTWAFSGPAVAAVLSILAAVAALYIAIAVKEPALLLQSLAYGALFMIMVSFLQRSQRRSNQMRLEYEKLGEEIHLMREETRHRADVEKALKKKIAQFLDLHRFSEILKSAQETREAAQKVATEAHQLLPMAEECVLYLVNESEQALALEAASRMGSGSVKEKKGSIFDQWVMKRCRPLLVEDARNDFRFSTEKKDATGTLGSLCAVPLMTENKVLGVLRAGSSQRHSFSSDDLRILDIVAGLGAVAVRNRLLYAKMESLALHDSLTGLYLYRYFQERLSEEIARANLKRSIFSLVLLDIDFFKRYNDEYGHSAGDIVLKNIAHVFSKCLHRADIAARYGGEEFIVLLPNKGKKEALSLAEDMRRQIEKSRFVVRRIEGAVTASFGVSAFPADGPSAEALVRAADRHLYEAKHTGRNRVCGGI